MKLVARTLIVCVGLTLLPAALMAAKKDKDAQEPPKQQVSRDAAKPFKAAQEAMEAKNYPEALAKLKEVQALPNKNPYDEHMLNEMFGFVYVRTGEFAEAAKALEASLSSGFLPEADRPQRIKALAQLNYQIKNYDKAIEFGNQAVEGGYADEDMETLVGQAHYVKGDYQGAMKFLEGSLGKQIQAGKTPKEQSLQIVMSSCVKLQDHACVTRSLERLVQYYPKQEYWNNLIIMLQQSDGGKNPLQVYRLALEVNAMDRAEDYIEMAQLSVEKGLPGEAQQVIEKGAARNIFTTQDDKTRSQRILTSVKPQAAADKASLAKSGNDGATTKPAARDVALGLAYYSYQQYQQAIQSLDSALSKGGFKSGDAEAEARLMLGISQLKAGNKEKAGEAFAQVKGNPTLERLGRLWLLYVNAPATRPDSNQPAAKRSDIQQPSRLDS